MGSAPSLPPLVVFALGEQAQPAPKVNVAKVDVEGRHQAEEHGGTQARATRASDIGRAISTILVERTYWFWPNLYPLDV